MILEGKKVRLRPLRAEDLDPILEWINDEEVTHTLLIGRYPMTREMEREWIEQRLKGSETDVSFVMETLDGTYLGGISLFRIQAVERIAELGLVIGRKSEWGKGYGTEGMGLLINYGFEQLNLHMIYLGVLTHNTHAHKMYRSLGFQEEGRLRHRVYRSGQYHDMISLSLLREEWAGLVGTS
jgi:RimJ/RimL family protein N-acetyltransferase